MSDMQGKLLRVLLVEDNPGDARLVLSALKASGSPSFHVNHEETLAGAIDRLRSGPPFDVVLLDLGLPDSSGTETLSRLQAAEAGVPVVIMTGLDDQRMAERALEAGAQDYLVKGDVLDGTVPRTVRYAIYRYRAEMERQSLSNQLTAQYDRMAEELALARTMQFDLLPTPDQMERCLGSHRLSVEGFFEPSSHIGGDLWGYLDGEIGQAVFFAFDFSGHGVGAALNVFRLHTLINDTGLRITDPAATLTRLNQALCNLLPRGQYATMILGVIDTRAGVFTWSAAGAPSPIFFGPDGSIDLLDTRGKPLGVAPDTNYKNRTISFPQQSSLFLYSDVMTESDVDGSMLGEDGLVAMVRQFYSPSLGINTQRLAAHFISVAGQPLADDMTAVSISHVASFGASGEVMDATTPWDNAGLTTEVSSSDPALAASAPLILTSRRVDAITTGLSVPYSGFVEITSAGLGDVGRACFDAADRGGLCLSLSVATAWSCGMAAQFCAALGRRYRLPLDWNAVDLCLSEAIANAVVHGCLGVESGLRETLSGLGRYNDAVSQGLLDQVRAAKRVEVSAVCRPDGSMELTVSDQGDGFDFNRHLTRAEPLSAKHGRGLALIRQTARTVTYLDSGRTIVITI